MRKFIDLQYTIRCLKIKEEVAFNIASEATGLDKKYIIKNAKNGQFWRVFENQKLE